MDREKVMSWLEGLAEPDWRVFHSDSEVQNIAKSALELLKEQDELGTELTNAVELIRKKNERIEKLLKEQEVRELTMDEWREWKANPKRNPICELWENDISPMWILIPDDVHEPALLMGKLKLFTGRPTLEQCKEVKWNEGVYR